MEWTPLPPGGAGKKPKEDKGKLGKFLRRAILSTAVGYGAGLTTNEAVKNNLEQKQTAISQTEKQKPVNDSESFIMDPKFEGLPEASLSRIDDRRGTNENWKDFNRFNAVYDVPKVKPSGPVPFEKDMKESAQRFRAEEALKAMKEKEVKDRLFRMNKRDLKERQKFDQGRNDRK